MTELAKVMKPHLEAMWAESDRLVQRVTRSVTGQVPSYAATPSSEVWIGMTRILERAAHGNPFGDPTEEDRLAAYGTGAQGARAGIAPEDLVAAILLGSAEVEADVMGRAAAAGVDAEVRLAASARSRRWAEQVTVWATQGLMTAERGDVERHVLEDRFVREVRAGMTGDALRRRAEALGVDPQRDWYAVLALGEPAVDPAATVALRLANPGALWSSVSADADGGLELVGLLPRVPRVGPELVVGVAGPAPLVDTAVTLAEASRAARAAQGFGRRGVSDLTGLGLLVPLHEDPALAARLVRRWIEPLQEPARHELVPTLRSWVAHDGQVDLVAREFAVHANTIRNRLARIGDVLGQAWREPASRAEIWAALQVNESNIVKISSQ